MPLSKGNVESISRLLTALSQRNTVIADLANRLASDIAWRSPDGQLALKVSEGERKQLEDFVRTYVQEVEVVITNIKAHLADA